MKEFKGYRILLADDEEIDLEIVSRIVKDLGAECVLAKSGEELLSVLNGPEGDKIDLVLTDINMPGMSGIDACSEFRASSHPKAKTLPVIGISADTNPAIFDRAISAGMNSMTLKPLTRDTLFAHFHITLKDNQANVVFSERIQQALAKSLFFSTVSHDIRTPLNSIVCFSEMLKHGFETKAEQDLAVNSILVSSKMLMQLVNDILDLSKLESGRMNIDLEPTDAARLVREIAASFGATHQKDGLEFLCRAGGVPTLMLDPHRLRQIAFNLVGNAIKFTDRGHVELRASYDLPDGAPSGVFRLEVEDTGCGISEEDLKRIGSAYVQVGSKLARNGGTGLGLAICGQLAAAMGGRLDVKSDLGIGSTFSVVVPGVRPAGDRGETAAPASEPALVPRVASASAPRRILAADDSRLNLMVLKALLKGMGDFEVVSAGDGQEALKILESPSEKPFDLVLTDMWMPNLDGEGLAKAIRANPALANLRVVAVTADVEFREKAREMGFDGILLKPITGEKLSRILAGEPAAGADSSA